MIKFIILFVTLYGILCKMMRKNVTSVLLFFCIIINAGGPWKMELTCPNEKINLNIDLYDESIEVPGMEMFGPMNGYLNGDIYGVWYVTGFDIKDDRNVTIKVANDLGSENQKISLIQTSDSTWTLKFEGQQVVKRAVGKKLVKIPRELVMKKK